MYYSAALSAALGKRCGNVCMVVETGEDEEAHPDAYLRGYSAGGADCSYPYPSHYMITSQLRLVARDGKVLWSDTVHGGKSRAPISSISDEAAKRLVKYLATHPVILPLVHIATRPTRLGESGKCGRDSVCIFAWTQVNGVLRYGGPL